MQALKELADRNQDRPNYEMTFTFKSDQVPGWEKTIHIDKENWFDLHKFEVNTCCEVVNPNSMLE